MRDLLVFIHCFAREETFTATHGSLIAQEILIFYYIFLRPKLTLIRIIHLFFFLCIWNFVFDGIEFFFLILFLSFLLIGLLFNYCWFSHFLRYLNLILKRIFLFELIIIILPVHIDSRWFLHPLLFYFSLCFAIRMR